MGIPRRYWSRLIVRGGKQRPGPDAAAQGVSGGTGSAGALWEPLSAFVDGDPTKPELVFASGDSIMVQRLEE